MFSKLDKMSKPKKKHEFDLSGLDESVDSGGGDSGNEQAGESEGEFGASPEAALSAPNPALEAASDDELMAEFQRRGLSADASAAPAEPDEDDMMDSGY